MGNEQNFFPWNDIPDSNLFPTGVFRMRIEELEDGVAQSSGNRMFRGRFACIEPVEFAGMAHFENFVVGNEQNPQGINPGTMGARSLKMVLNKAQVPPTNDIAAILASSKGAEFLMAISLNTPTKGERAGIPQNRMVDCYKLGERPVGVTQQGAPGAISVSAPPPPMAPPMASQPVHVVPPPQPVYAPPVMQAPPAYMPPPVAPPVYTPPPAYVPPVAPPQALTHAPAPAAAPAGPQMLCTICQQYVPVSQFGAHIQAHASAGGSR